MFEDNELDNKEMQQTRISRKNENIYTGENREDKKSFFF